MKVSHTFVTSAGILLLITGLAKIFSSFGHVPIANYPDPLLGIRYRELFRFVGLIEIAAAIYCFLGKYISRQLTVTLVVAMNFGAYRLGLIAIGYKGHCPCLGDITDSLHIAPQTADNIMSVALVYLLVGSLLLLAFARRRNEYEANPIWVESVGNPPREEET